MRHHIRRWNTIFRLWAMICSRFSMQTRRFAHTGCANWGLSPFDKITSNHILPGNSRALPHPMPPPPFSRTLPRETCNACIRHTTSSSFSTIQPPPPSPPESSFRVTPQAYPLGAKEAGASVLPPQRYPWLWTTIRYFPAVPRWSGPRPKKNVSSSLWCQSVKDRL